MVVMTHFIKESWSVNAFYVLKNWFTVSYVVQLFINVDQVMMFNTQVPMCRICTLWEFAHNALRIDSLWSPWVSSEVKKVVTDRCLWNIPESLRPMSVFETHETHGTLWSSWETLEHPRKSPKLMRASGLNAPQPLRKILEVKRKNKFPSYEVKRKINVIHICNVIRFKIVWISMRGRGHTNSGNRYRSNSLLIKDKRQDVQVHTERHKMIIKWKASARDYAVVVLNYENVSHRKLVH